MGFTKYCFKNSLDFHNHEEKQWRNLRKGNILGGFIKQEREEIKEIWNNKISALIHQLGRWLTLMWDNSGGNCEWEGGFIWEFCTIFATFL